jgi:hypothetical protein
MTDDFLAERGPLMAERNRLRERLRALNEADRWRPAVPLRDRLTQIRRRYEALLPEVTVARCPFDGGLVRWPIDTAGLDGSFWDYRASARRHPQARPPRWLAMTGAMDLTAPVEHTPYLAIPGPGVPFVVPRILGRQGVRAVVAQVPVGAHTGWAISYFGPLPDTSLVNLWGTDTYPVVDDDGRWLGWDRVDETASAYDFELAGWVGSGKLLWIEPGDDSGTLHEGLDGCPYVGLSGPRKIGIVAEGEVRYVNEY